MYDATLPCDALNARWVRFSGVTFGVAPVEEWPALRRSLLEFEQRLAAHQHDVGLVQEFPFDPAVPRGTRVSPKPYVYEPEKRMWLRKEMQLMCDHGVLERSDDVDCAGGVVLVEGQKEGTKYRFCTDFREINVVS